MKCILMILMVVIMPFIKATGQITKGNWMVGGNASFSSTKYNSAQSIPGTITTFQLSPNVGYFFADKLAGGIVLNLTSSDAYSSIKQLLYQFGPFVKYYFLEPEKAVNLFTEVGYEYGSIKNPSRKTSTFFIMAGPVVYFNQSVGMEFTLGYYSTKYNLYTGADNTFQVGIGFQIHLEKK